MNSEKVNPTTTWVTTSNAVIQWIQTTIDLYRTA
jgi:hypothetical protein